LGRLPAYNKDSRDAERRRKSALREKRRLKTSWPIRGRQLKEKKWERIKRYKRKKYSTPQPSRGEGGKGSKETEIIHDLHHQSIRQGILPQNPYRADIILKGRKGEEG